MDGLETCRRLKALPSFAQVPVIFVSVLTDVIDKVQAFESGGVDYITKPVRSEEVAVRVATQLRVHRLQRELATQNAALRERARQLEELERLRDGYIHMIIHDLRSPMTGLGLSLDLISDLTTDDGELRPLVEEARSSLERARDLTEQVLRINQLEAGVVRLKTQRAELSSLVEEVLTQSRPILTTIPVVVEGNAATVLCDPEMVRRVMENLLQQCRSLHSVGWASPNRLESARWRGSGEHSRPRVGGRATKSGTNLRQVSPRLWTLITVTVWGCLIANWQSKRTRGTFG